MTFPPRLQAVERCRVCGSRRVLDAGCVKRYYLINLDQTIELSYATCQDCQFIFQSQYVGDEFLTEIAAGADGNLYNKVVKVIPQVNQTLGVPEDEYKKTGQPSREAPACP